MYTGKLLFFLIVIFYCKVPLFAQKKKLEYSVYNNWPTITGVKISYNGKYITYCIGSSLFVQSVDNLWKKEIKNAFNVSITCDSRFVVFCLQNNKIGILELGGRDIKMIPNVSSYEIPREGNGQWLAYQLIGNDRPLILFDLFTGHEKRYNSVTDCHFSTKGAVLLLQTKYGKENIKAPSALLWLNLVTAQLDTIMKNDGPALDFTFDKMEEQLAFIVQRNSDRYKYNILKYYKIGMDSATIKADDQTYGMSPNLTIGKGFKMPKFSGDGSKIFFKLEKKARSVNYDIHANEIVNVDIWNYKDVYLQAQQLKDISNETYRTYTAVMNVEGNKVIQLDTEDDEWFSVKLSNDGNAKYVLVNSKCNSWDMVWNAEGRSNVYLVSTLDGSRKLVKEHLYGNVEYSSNGKYVIWYDQEKSSYFTYNTENASIKNITEKIHAPFYDEEDDHPGKPSNVWILGWMLNDEAVFVYDRYDIWQLDPNGEKSPQNITKGYGRKNNIIFRYVNVNGYSSIQPNQELLLMGFNIINKNNGFFSIRLKKSDNPKKLAMGRYIYYLPQLSPSSFIPALSSTPIRARDTDAYIVRRMNTTTYPNLYFTKDFKKFSTLTNIHPEKNYNWMTSELVHWRIPNGLKAEGILYKPENFNPKKRYPVIFYFYEKLSDQLNNFLTPTAAGGPIDIPYFVSNEYLVFVPNIYYKIGEPGESVYNSIISAAKYISKMPWVDSTKLGLQGHSFGGYEVNYLITRSKIFTAAMSAAGISDLVSMYGTLRPAVGTSNQYSFEDQQFRIGESLLKNQNLYIKNSPIFRAKNVSVPLLLMHNKNDGAVPWEQAIEFFINLRESNKKVWMLQYINGGHEIGRPADTEDFTVRVAQFFDYYLKDSIMPKWMADAQ